MAVVNVSAKYLEKETGLKKEKIREVLEKIGFPTEIAEEELLIEITPDRPDCYLASGIVRAIESFTRKKMVRYTTKKSEYKITVLPSVKGVRPYLSACVVKNLKISEEELEQLIDAQEKMHETSGRKRRKLAIGVHNLDVVEFPLRYEAVKEYEFVPLEFTRKMSIGEILEKHPKGIEYASLVERGKYPLIYEEKTGSVVSFPPIINEDRTKLYLGVKNIFVEMTGTHKETVENGVNIFACSLADMGGEIYEVKINNEIHPKLEYKKERIEEKRINKLLGTELTKTEIKNSLEKMGYFIKGEIIEIPPYRGDIIEYADIIEDVAIGYGYENFEPKLPNFFSSGKCAERTKKENKIREIMNGLGFLEVVTPLLVAEDSVEKKSALKILNPCSVEYTYVRESLLNSLLKVLESNKMKGLPQKIYEIGVGYEEKKERRVLAFAIMDKKIDFNEIRSYAQTVMKELGKRLVLDITEDNKYKQGRFGRILENGKVKGNLGELDRKFLEKNSVGFEVGYFEIEF